ncbi:MAG: chlorite dismutase family protein [Immundisolibacterales bacterium]|nr:chlorite dismutase family protein [Immundisolibacterales bacterium]
MSESERTPPSAPPAPDLSEKGTRDGGRTSLDRRLFLKFTAFGGCHDAGGAARALEESGVTGALYLDANDPRGIGIVAASEDPDHFVTGFRDLLGAPPFDRMEHKAELDMLGRTYSIGYESDLEHVLFERPISRIADPALRWAIWYPLRRAKSFARLSADDQRRILAEHGTLGHRYGAAGLALDVRLACHGLDKNDNDFIIGLLGAELFPLSSIVQSMRGTEQTSRYLESLGPFFVGRAVWQGRGRTAAS